MSAFEEGQRFYADRCAAMNAESGDPLGWRGTPWAAEGRQLNPYGRLTVQFSEWNRGFDLAERSGKHARDEWIYGLIGA